MVTWWLSHGAFEAAAALALFKSHATDALLLQLPTSTLTRDLVSLLKQLLVRNSGSNEQLRKTRRRG
jgi:hypothetical protein